jgi:hypothetical protein
VRAAVVLAIALLLAAPGFASAEPVFDGLDAEELAATLTDASADQDVCYGWKVDVSDPVTGLDSSVGSNFGAGVPVSSQACGNTVEFIADIVYTSESSESEDSATYDVRSSAPSITRADLDALGIDFGGLTGDNVDVVVASAVAALPLLAADAGIAEPVAAAVPETGTAPADAQVTDISGSDWWRANGGLVWWGGGLIAAAALFAWWVLRSNRRRPTAASEPLVYVPDTVPEEFYQRPAEPPTDSLPAQQPTETPSPPVEPGESTVDKPAPDATPGPERERPAPPDQKDKE